MFQRIVGTPVPEMLQGILSAVRNFSRTTTVADDITVAVTRFQAAKS